VIKKIKHIAFIFSIVMIVSGQFLYAQDLGMFQEQNGHDLIVDEALDQVEVNIDQVPNDTVVVKTEIPGDAKAETEMDTPVEVEILKDIIIDDAIEPQKTHETKIIPLLHAEASSIIDTLNGMKSSTGEVMYNEEDRTLILEDFPEQLEAMSAYVKEVDILLETEIFKLQYVQAQDIIEKIRDVLTKNVGQVQFDQRANSIVATDTPSKIGKIKELISGLDLFNKEIQIETKILQIVLNDEHMMGVDWEAIVSDFQNIDFIGFSFGTDLDEKQKLNVGAVSQEDYEILLEALDTVGVINIVSDDVMKTENEGTKTVSILPVLLREAHGSNPDGSDDSGQGEMVQFHLTPMINRDNLITVTIEPKKNELRRNGLPIQNFHLDASPLEVGSLHNSAERLTRAPKPNAVIQIENGETIVIGSLFEEVMVESTWKIPLLGDLPLLGFVFRNQGEKPRKAEIITFLTVKIIEKK